MQMLGKKIQIKMKKKSVLILGASSDIGLSTIKIFLNNNWKVYCHYNSSKVFEKDRNKDLEFIKINFSDSEKIIYRKLKKLQNGYLAKDMIA